MAPNVPALYELHFGVPMAGAILSALNVSLDAPTLAILLKQLNPKIIFVDHKLIHLLFKAIESDHPCKLLVVVIPELDPPGASCTTELPAGCLDYGSLVASSDNPDFKIVWPKNECEPISVNFTSGSTGIPKAAVYSHRAAYLNSIGMIFLSEIMQPPVFLWTVDMFRCNGWCFAWAVAALGGTNVCLRENYTASPDAILSLIVHHKVTLLCGKPILLNQIALAVNLEQPLPCAVDVFVSGPLPAAHVITRVKEMGFNVKVGYGMTEALGPAITRPWDPETDSTSPALGFQRVHNIMLQDVDVKDPITMTSVPNDGTTVGEVMFRGNTMMMGYLNNPQGTRDAFSGGWYHTRDIGVRLPSGGIQLKDRAVDIIALGPGRLVSSLEVEEVLTSHSEVVEAAVIGCPGSGSDGQVPCAFVKVRKGSDLNEEEIVEFCARCLPSHMVPRAVYLGDLPKNSTGKIQKYLLREWANANGKLAH